MDISAKGVVLFYQKMPENRWILQRRGSCTIKYLVPYKGKYWILDIILSKTEYPYLARVLCLSGRADEFQNTFWDSLNLPSVEKLCACVPLTDWTLLLPNWCYLFDRCGSVTVWQCDSVMVWWCDAPVTSDCDWSVTASNPVTVTSPLSQPWSHSSETWTDDVD